MEHAEGVMVCAHVSSILLQNSNNFCIIAYFSISPSVFLHVFSLVKRKSS